MGCADGDCQRWPKEKNCWKCGVALFLPPIREIDGDVIIEANGTKDLLVQIPTEILESVSRGGALSWSGTWRFHFPLKPIVDSQNLECCQEKWAVQAPRQFPSLWT